MTGTSRDDALDVGDRYGTGPASPKRVRRFAIATAVVFAVGFIAWVAWGGLFAPASQVSATDAGTTTVSDHEVEVEFELTVPAGHTSSCALQALTSTFTIVGWRIVDFPASNLTTRSLTETVRTTERAVTGLIYRCWLT